MPIFKVGYEFTAWSEKEIEAESKEEALRILEKEASGPLDDWFEGNIVIGDLCQAFADEQ